MKKELRNKLIVCGAAIALAAAMLLLYFFGVAPKNVSKNYDSQAEKTVTLEILYSGREYKYNNLDASGLDTVFDLLEKYNAQLNLGMEYDSYGSSGIFITGLKNTHEDTEKGYYYTYTLNGGYADAASSQQIKDGDVIAFKYLFEVWEEIDGEWVATASELKPAFEPKTMFYTVMILAAVLVVLSVAYIIISIIKSKKMI